MMGRSPRGYWPAFLVVLIVSFAVRLHFWLSTHWTIEDALIIARMVRNLLQHGELSFNVGERVSSATSPLFALLTSGIAWLGIDPLVAAKILGLLASTAACVLVFRFLCKFAAPAVAATAACAYALLPPVIAYSVAGMETGLYTLVCFLALERLAGGRMLAAVVWGSLAVLVRLDGALILLTVGVFMVRELRGDWRRVLRCIAPALVLLPAGVALHALYYHSLVPHSVVAKAMAYEVDQSVNVSRYLQRMFLTQKAGLVVYLLAMLGTLRLRDRARWLVPFVVWYFAYHLFFIMRAPLFEWYLQPPLIVLGMFTGLGLLAIPAFILRRERSRSLWAQAAPGALLAACLLASLPRYAQAKANAQSYENQVREKVSLWLSTHTSSDRLVFTESLGYVGYHAPNRFVDWPGLASRDVPTLLKRDNVLDPKNAYEIIISHFRPDYLALRVSEWDSLSPSVREEYSVCAHFPTPTKALGPSYLIAAAARP